MARTAKTFRFDDETLAELATLCERWDVSQTEAIQRAIQCAIQNAIQSNTECNTDSEESIEWRDLYLSEKSRADRLEDRNEKLQDRMADLSDRIADSLQASQVLQAAEKEDLLPPGDQPPDHESGELSRMDHFRAIFKRKKKRKLS